MSPSVIASETMSESTRIGVAPAMFQILTAFPNDRAPFKVRAPQVVVYAMLPTTQTSAVYRSGTSPRPSTRSANEVNAPVESPPASMILLSHAVDVPSMTAATNVARTDKASRVRAGDGRRARLRGTTILSVISYPVVTPHALEPFRALTSLSSPSPRRRSRPSAGEAFPA